jgi:uncharacterized protein (TIGR03118 family)
VRATVLRRRQIAGGAGRAVDHERDPSHEPVCKENPMSRFGKFVLVAAAVAALAAGITPSQAANKRYHQENLVSDLAGVADHQDPDLVNPWGIAFNPTGFVWVADNGTGKSTLYDGLGNKQGLVVEIPGPPTLTQPGLPTGIVFNGSGDFVMTNGTASGPSRFIFAGQDGVIAAWAPAVDLTHALVAAYVPAASYFGIALADDGTGNFLYAADFLGGKIDKFDSSFQPVATGGFVDPSIPGDFGPFNIQNIQGTLYVTYAKRELEDGGVEEVPGPGLGYVNAFDTNGNLIRRIATRGKLNAPWGLALAPAGFGKFEGMLLVGNFGDGTINAYDPGGGFRGQLRGADNKPLTNEGLWGMAFGNGIQNQPTGTLFFAAGIDDETHGLYGAITPTPGGEEDDSAD